jgi:hypothetical protein
LCVKFQYFSELEQTLDQNKEEIQALIQNLRRQDLSEREKEGIRHQLKQLLFKSGKHKEQLDR